MNDATPSFTPDPSVKSFEFTRLTSIHHAPMHCPACDWRGFLGLCVPDVNGEGDLGCPTCNGVVMENNGFSA